MVELLICRVEGKRLKSRIYIVETDTVFQLKQKVEEDLDVEVSRQTIELNEQVLENDRQLLEYPNEDDLVFKLTVKPIRWYFPIKVISRAREDTNREFTIVVFESDDVYDLKLKIFLEWQKYTAAIYKLTRLGLEMDDNDTLLDYHVRENCVIDLEIDESSLA